MKFLKKFVGLSGALVAGAISLTADVLSTATAFLYFVADGILQLCEAVTGDKPAAKDEAAT